MTNQSKEPLDLSQFEVAVERVQDEFGDTHPVSEGVTALLAEVKALRGKEKIYDAYCAMFEEKEAECKALREEQERKDNVVIQLIGIMGARMSPARRKPLLEATLNEYALKGTTP